VNKNGASYRYCFGRHSDNGRQKEGMAMEASTLDRESRQQGTVCRVIFTVDRDSAKILSVTPVVDSDEELAQLEPWIQACLILSELISCPKHSQDRAAA